MSILEHTCRETFSDIDTHATFEAYLINHYPSLTDTVQTFRRLKIRAEFDLVVCIFIYLLQTISFVIRSCHIIFNTFKFIIKYE